ncbi:hypothetical protein [Limosilactobacillus fastidiosus]|uniref:Uncharacterized protein n=1 Tax=Limosilactobacillus fastidiosus TaxID=2759855 RepID=A0A7W3YCV0_9LACO|nr:hypothetical protein [Limosilactobacillus fastidiosus]MBB1086688.1 hypothetical protein [Limosilactobacillus fastidiosus]MCD7085585.1 hypothetical protein [Limosilactobacillus fastidiosus]MCD7114816.1 hypothetical protein [Limosilactobacillus fastidiosus]MCD7115935.1 hypothetical protein [Limosilactobacillus fastidiosus]
MTAWIIILFSWYLFMALAINLMAFLNVLIFRDLFLYPSNLLEKIFLLEATRGLQKKLLSWLIEKGR